METQHAIHTTCAEEMDAAIIETLIQAAADITIQGGTTPEIAEEANAFLTAWFRRKMPSLGDMPHLT